MPTHSQQPSMTIIDGLAQVAFLALQDQFPNTRVALDEVHLLVDTLEVLAPESPKPAFARGTLHIMKKNWQEAIEVFRALAAEAKCLPHSKAMLAYALNKIGNPEWRTEANALRNATDEGISSLVRALVALDDPGASSEPVTPARDTHAEPADSEALGNEPSAPKARADAPAWTRYALRA